MAMWCKLVILPHGVVVSLPWAVLTGHATRQSLGQKLQYVCSRSWAATKGKECVMSRDSSSLLPASHRCWVPAALG